MWIPLALAAALAATATVSSSTPILPSWEAQPASILSILTDEGLDSDTFTEMVANRRIVTQRRPLAPGQDGAHVAAIAWIDAPIEAVWDAVANCRRLPEFMPNFVSCEDVEPDHPLPAGTRWNRNRMEFRVFPAKIKVELIVEARLEPPHLLRWRRIRGDTRRNEGYWRLIPIAPRGVLLVYDTSADAGPVPDFVQRALTARNLPGSVEAVRRRSEGTP